MGCWRGMTIRSFTSCLLHKARHRGYLVFPQIVKFSAMSAVKRSYDDIAKSEEDKRSYRGLELNNGLKVLLISDPSTDKSSAALDVHIGHVSDPSHLPGLAHFCEHMLFLGTDWFPDENEYSKFLSQHGGSFNAFTSSDHTNYYFDVSPDNLGGALDRFSQFFLTPLFTESATEREVNAVNSEHEKNIPNDTWRINQIEKATSDQKHDFSKFGTGNKETLDVLPKEKGVSVRDSLLEFHSAWYSSNIMGLAVLGREELDKLQEMVVDRFTGVVDKSVVVPEWTTAPFSDDQREVLIIEFSADNFISCFADGFSHVGIQAKLFIHLRCCFLQDTKCLDHGKRHTFSGSTDWEVHDRSYGLCTIVLAVGHFKITKGISLNTDTILTSHS